MRVKVVWTSRDWVDAVAALPVQEPLPCRIVLVRRERVAHSLRRDLIRNGLGNVLAGTRFVPFSAAAAEVLRNAGAKFESGEEALRAARLSALFRSQMQLRHFSRDLLCSKPGWEEAFARTISDLEGAGLRPEDLDVSGQSAPLQDVAAIWRAIDDSAGRSWTVQRTYLEAAIALDDRPETWPFQGTALAFVGGEITAAEARFFRAVPEMMIGLLAARPARERYLNRMEALLGKEVGNVLRSTAAPRVGGTERDLIASYLFEPPIVLADPDRPRSTGPDDTVDIEEHAGVEAEIEATADWVARQMAEGTALEEMAVLVPALDPLAGLVANRLARIPWHDGSFPVHVAGGLPITYLAAGTRALAVVRALRAHLAAGSLADVLPALRSSAAGGRHLSHGAAMDLSWSLGTVGGNPARPEGALDWADRAAEREAELSEQFARAQAAENEALETGLARRAIDIERLLTDLRAIRPALDALVGLARLAVEGTSLTMLWPRLFGFFDEWLLQPGDRPWRAHHSQRAPRQDGVRCAVWNARRRRRPANCRRSNHINASAYRTFWRSFGVSGYRTRGGWPPVPRGPRYRPSRRTPPFDAIGGPRHPRRLARSSANPARRDGSLPADSNRSQLARPTCARLSRPQCGVTRRFLRSPTRRRSLRTRALVGDSGGCGGAGST